MQTATPQRSILRGLRATATAAKLLRRPASFGSLALCNACSGKMQEDGGWWPGLRWPFRKNFQDSLSHRIFGRMYGALNIDENKN
jgi:hypothetical protein